MLKCAFFFIVIFITTTYDAVSITSVVERRIDSLEKLLQTASNKNKIEALNNLSILYSESNPGKAIEYGYKSLNLSITIKDRKGEANAYIAIGLGYIYNKEIEKGMSNLEIGLNKSEELGNDILSVQALSYIGSSLKSLNQYDKALEKYYKALSLAAKTNDRTANARILNNIASIYNAQGNLRKALEYNEKSLAVKIELKDKEGISNSYNNIGIIYKDWGQYDKALEYQHKSLNLKNELKDTLGMALSYLNIGVIYKNLENYDKSLEYFNKALDIARKINDMTNVAKAYNNIGNLYNKLGRQEQALDYLTQAIDIFRSTGDKINAAKTNNNIGNLYSNMGNEQKALQYYETALSIHNEIGDEQGKSITLLNIGNIYMKLGKFRESEEYLIKSLAIAEKQNIKEVEKDIYNLLSTIYSNKGEHQSALDYYKKYERVKDLIISVDTKKRVSELQLKYDVSQKEKEIELLKKDSEIKINQNKFLIVLSFLLLSIAIVVAGVYYAKKKNNSLVQEKNYELKLANEKLITSEVNLKELNDAKDKYFSIIAHDLRNPIGVFISVCDYIEKRYDELSRNELKEYINDLSESAKNVLDLLENMLEWSRSQTGKMKFTPESFDLASLVDNNMSLLNVNAKNKNIELSADVKKNTVVYGDTRMINAIIRNLVSNALKFTPNGGFVKILSEVINGYVQVSIADSGVGISKADVSKLFRMDVHFTTPGTMDEKGTGLGLILCKEWVEKQGGDINVESEPGKGSTFSFTLPRSNEIHTNGNTN